MPDRAPDGGVQMPGAATSCGQDVPGWAPFARAEIEQTVFARFERIARANAERAAVITRAGCASYRELDGEANRIARAIRDRADAASGAIATLLDGDSRLAAAMLAIFKLGRLYVPVDSRCPVPRGAFMLDDVAARIVLTGKRHEDRARQIDTERALTRIWADVLQLTDVGIDDPFLDLGGDSLRAAEIALRVRIRFAARVSVADLLTSATIAAMAIRVDSRRKSLQSP